MGERLELYKLGSTIKTAKLLQHPEAFQLLLQLEKEKKRYGQFVCSKSKGWLLRRLLQTQLITKERGLYSMTPRAEMILAKLHEAVEITDLETIQSIEKEIKLDSK